MKVYSPKKIKKNLKVYSLKKKEFERFDKQNL